jgi:hypothetical protein
MAATVVIATLFLFLSGSEPDQQVSEPITETPAVQKMFIEVNIGPLVVEEIEITSDGAAAVVENPVNDKSAETREPIGTDVEPRDQIEPLFVEEVEPLITEPVVPSVLVEDRQVADETATIAEPQPFIVKQGAGDQIAPTPEPVAEPIQTVEPDIVAVPATVVDAEQKTVAEQVANPSSEAAGQVLVDADPSDAIEPMIIENNENIDSIPELPIEAIEEAVVSPSVETTEPAQPPAEALVTVEPLTEEPATEELVAEEKAETCPDVLSDDVESGGPVTERFEALEPAIIEDAGIGTPADENSIPDSGTLFDL